MPLVSDIEWDREFGRWTYTVTAHADKGKVMHVSFDTRELAACSRLAMMLGDDQAALIGSEIEMTDSVCGNVRRTA